MPRLMGQSTKLHLAAIVLSGFSFNYGVEQLGSIARARIIENIGQLALHLDMDGTLTAAGQPLCQRAIRVINELQKLNVPVSCNTAQSNEYLLAAGGDVFMARVNELGLRVQHSDGNVVTTPPPRFGAELESAKQFLRDRPAFNVLLVEKNGGFAFKFSDKDGRLASHNQVNTTCEFVRKLVLRNEQLTFVKTDGFIDVCSAILSKRYGALVQMQCKSFKGCFHVAAGDGRTDERMFEVVDLAVKVGREPSRADTRLKSHVEMLDVLEWIAQMRAMHNEFNHKDI